MFPAPVAAVFAKTSSWFRALSKATRILFVSTGVLAAVFVSYLGYRQTHEPYAVLFGQLEQDDAGAIVAKLKELNAPYRLGVGGSTIEVPESRVGELRLELASSGMPRGGGVGFESFDKMKLGATEFEQRVLYRRALEGELARTIGTLAAVQSARVHLVLPEKSVFIARAEPASASIVLRLRTGRALGPSEVSGIVHLTAASVAGLAADRVALLTTDGEMLRKPRDASDGTAQASEEDQGSRQHTIEVQLEERARLMLEKVVGPGHVDVRVTAELDPARVERVEEHYDPGKTVLRSEESSVERTGGGLDESVAGVPGAESNLPNGSAPAAGLIPPIMAAAKGDAGAPKALAAVAKGASDQPFRESHTRNYEVDHVSEKRFMEPGTLKRVAVAVVVDGVPHTENGQTTIVPRDRRRKSGRGRAAPGRCNGSDEGVARLSSRSGYCGSSSGRCRRRRRGSSSQSGGGRGRSRVACGCHATANGYDKAGHRRACGRHRACGRRSCDGGSGPSRLAGQHGRDRSKADGRAKLTKGCRHPSCS
jgi:flagellar basal-body M-ring protein/flagellar hook-basal body protein fliF